MQSTIASSTVFMAIGPLITALQRSRAVLFIPNSLLYFVYTIIKQFYVLFSKQDYYY